MKYSYIRKTLFRNKDLEVAHITWKVGDVSPLHQHGKCMGLIKVLKGSIYEQSYIKRGSRFLPGRKKIFKKGSYIVENALGIHRVGNAGRTTAETLNLYLPPVKNKEIEV